MRGIVALVTAASTVLGKAAAAGFTGPVLALRGNVGLQADLRRLLEDPEIVKVVLSGQNDLFITQNVQDGDPNPRPNTSTAPS